MTNIELVNLLNDGEVIAEYGTTKSYCTFNAITESGSTDICAALEDTLHRILEKGGDKEDVYRIMGAFIPTDEERVDMEEFEEYIEIDLGYAIDGLISFWSILN